MRYARERTAQAGPSALNFTIKIKKQLVKTTYFNILRIMPILSTIAEAFKGEKKVSSFYLDSGLDSADISLDR